MTPALIRHEASLGELRKDYVVVSCLARIGQVQEFLASRFQGTDAQRFELALVLPTGVPAALHESMSLHEMAQKFHVDAAALDLLYRYK